MCVCSPDPDHKYVGLSKDASGTDKSISQDSFYLFT
jgi:hypothetical protein